MRSIPSTLIRMYQKALPVRKVVSQGLLHVDRSCRFIPTCSDYTLQSIKKHGLLKGMALGLWRFLRCNPFSKGGYDPV